MNNQLYLHERLRTKLRKQIELIVDTFIQRISPVFENIEKEADEKRDEYYNSFATKPWNGEEDITDLLSDAADNAVEIGFTYYENISLMRYNNLAAWLTILYQFWEQQVRLFLYKEESRYYKIDFKNFCAKGINEIKNKFVYYNIDIEKLPSWVKINELRLLSNTLKHGDGGSAQELKQLQPSIFRKIDFSFGGDTLDLYKTTLNEEVLNISDDMFKEYGACLIDFWSEFPERM